MATLTETAYVARRVIKYGSMGLLSLTVLWFVGTGAINWWNALHPEPPPPPTADFGPLPAIKFSANAAEIKEFVLQTGDGKLGVFPDRIDVYSAPTRKSSFGDEGAAMELARQLDFLFEPTKLSRSLYRFTAQEPLPTSFEINIVTGAFTYKRQWQADPSLIVSKRFLGDQQVVFDAQNFMRQAGLFKDDLVGEEKTRYFRVTGDKLIGANSLSEADFVEVSLFRKPIELLDDKKKVVATYPFFTPDPKKGIVAILVSGTSDDKKKIIDVDYKYIEVNYDVKGSYPLKTVELAWEELKSGAGYIASGTSGSKGVVRRVALGYYDSAGDQSYTMPIYVFRGDNDFVAYVSAVDESQIIK